MKHELKLVFPVDIKNVDMSFTIISHWNLVITKLGRYTGVDNPLDGPTVEDKYMMANTTLLYDCCMGIVFASEQ